MLVNTCSTHDPSTEDFMKTRIQASIAATLAALALGGCAGMTHEEKSTLAGAAVGGLAGSAISGGSTAGTVGGAVVGGVVGHEVGKRY
jgi:osmotically inducible lipoprotein OsmB